MEVELVAPSAGATCIGFTSLAVLKQRKAKGGARTLRWCPHIGDLAPAALAAAAPFSNAAFASLLLHASAMPDAQCLPAAPGDDSRPWRLLTFSRSDGRLLYVDIADAPAPAAEAARGVAVAFSPQDNGLWIAAVDGSTLPPVPTAAKANGAAAEAAPPAAAAAAGAGGGGGGGCDCPLCPTAQHRMVVSDGAGHYSSFSCNQCGDGGEGLRWFCAECGDDLCFTCVPRLGLCPDCAAPMALDEAGPPFECSKCSNGDLTGPRWRRGIGACSHAGFFCLSCHPRDGGTYQSGERVRVRSVSPSEAERICEIYCGWEPSRMQHYLGRECAVQDVDDDGQVNLIDPDGLTVHQGSGSDSDSDSDSEVNVTCWPRELLERIGGAPAPPAHAAADSSGGGASSLAAGAAGAAAAAKAGPSLRMACFRNKGLAAPTGALAPAAPVAAPAGWSGCGTALVGHLARLAAPHASTGAGSQTLPWTLNPTPQVLGLLARMLQASAEVAASDPTAEAMAVALLDLSAAHVKVLANLGLSSADFAAPDSGENTVLDRLRDAVLRVVEDDTALAGSPLQGKACALLSSGLRVFYATPAQQTALVLRLMGHDATAAAGSAAGAGLGSGLASPPGSPRLKRSTSSASPHRQVLFRALLANFATRATIVPIVKSLSDAPVAGGAEAASPSDAGGEAVASAFSTMIGYLFSELEDGDPDGADHTAKILTSIMAEVLSAAGDRDPPPDVKGAARLKAVAAPLPRLLAVVVGQVATSALALGAGLAARALACVSPAEAAQLAGGSALRSLVPIAATGLLLLGAGALTGGLAADVLDAAAPLQKHLAALAIMTGMATGAASAGESKEEYELGESKHDGGDPAAAADVAQWLPALQDTLTYLSGRCFGALATVEAAPAPAAVEAESEVVAEEWTASELLASVVELNDPTPLSPFLAGLAGPLAAANGVEAAAAASGDTAGGACFAALFEVELDGKTPMERMLLKPGNDALDGLQCLTLAALFKFFTADGVAADWLAQFQAWKNEGGYGKTGEAAPMAAALAAAPVDDFDDLPPEAPIKLKKQRSRADNPRPAVPTLVGRLWAQSLKVRAGMVARKSQTGEPFEAIARALAPRVCFLLRTAVDSKLLPSDDLGSAPTAPSLQRSSSSTSSPARARRASLASAGKDGKKKDAKLAAAAVASLEANDDDDKAPGSLPRAKLAPRASSSPAKSPAKAALPISRAAGLWRKLKVSVQITSVFRSVNALRSRILDQASTDQFRAEGQFINFVLDTDCSLDRIRDHMLGKSHLAGLRLRGLTGLAASASSALVLEGWASVVEERSKIGAHPLDGLGGCGFGAMARITDAANALSLALVSIFSNAKQPGPDRLRALALALPPAALKIGDFEPLVPLLAAVVPHLRTPAPADLAAVRSTGHVICYEVTPYSCRS